MLALVPPFLVLFHMREKSIQFNPLLCLLLTTSNWIQFWTNPNAWEQLILPVSPLSYSYSRTKHPPPLFVLWFVYSSAWNVTLNHLKFWNYLVQMTDHCLYPYLEGATHSAPLTLIPRLSFLYFQYCSSWHVPKEEIHHVNIQPYHLPIISLASSQ